MAGRRRGEVRAPRRGVRRPSTPSAARAGRPSRPRPGRGRRLSTTTATRVLLGKPNGHQSRPYHSGGDAFDDDDDDLVRAGVGTEADDAPAFPAMRKEGFFGEDGEEISADDLAMHGTTTNASKALDAVYKKNEARMRALGLAEDGAGFNDQGPGGLDPVRARGRRTTCGSSTGCFSGFSRRIRGGTPTGPGPPAAAGGGRVRRAGWVRGR